MACRTCFFRLFSTLREAVFASFESPDLTPGDFPGDPNAFSQIDIVPCADPGAAAPEQARDPAALGALLLHFFAMQQMT
jgi:hypothetical protein